MSPVAGRTAPPVTNALPFDGRMALARLEVLGVIQRWQVDSDGYYAQTDLGLVGPWTDEEVRRYVDGALVALRAVMSGEAVYHPRQHGFVAGRDIPQVRADWELSSLVCLGVKQGLNDGLQ